MSAIVFTPIILLYSCYKFLSSLRPVQSTVQNVSDTQLTANLIRAWVELVTNCHALKPIKAGFLVFHVVRGSLQGKEDFISWKQETEKRFSITSSFWHTYDNCVNVLIPGRTKTEVGQPVEPKNFLSSVQELMASWANDFEERLDIWSERQGMNSRSISSGWAVPHWGSNSTVVHRTHSGKDTCRERSLKW